MRELLTLEGLRRFDDLSLLSFRLLVGAFLVYGVADNVLSAERMTEFAAFLGRFGFPAPDLMAPLSAYAQLFCGVAFVLGLCTRWAGLVCAINFVVAVVMVDRLQGVRASFPAASLVLFGLYMATHGPGRFALDALVLGRERRLRRLQPPRATSS